MSSSSEELLIHLPSDATLQTNPQNSLNDFRVTFQKPINLLTYPGTLWEMGMSEISLPNAIYALHEDDKESVAIIKTSTPDYPIAPRHDDILDQMSQKAAGLQSTTTRGGETDKLIMEQLEKLY